jgi:hypothetical protein
MELWLVLIALWLWECLHFLPPGGAYVTLARPRARVRRRAGLFLASPWPLRLGFALDGLPFEATAERVIGAGPLSLLAATGGLRAERALAWERAEADGALVKLAGKPLLRASSEASASRIAGVICDIARMAPEQRIAGAHAALRAALASDGAEARIARVRRATLPHRALAALSLAGIALGLPALALGSQVAWDSIWQNTWPAWVALHALGVAALAYAESRLGAPGRAGRLLRAALYPPTQWRSSSELAGAALGDLHPLVVVRSAAEGGTFTAWARSALAECEYPRFAAEVPAADAAERRGALSGRRAELAAFFARAGVADAITAPPLRRDAGASSYCPRCFEEFVAADWVCTDCGVETRRFALVLPDAPLASKLNDRLN